jgi:hypothetical protein
MIRSFHDYLAIKIKLLGRMEVHGKQPETRRLLADVFDR